MRWWLSVTVFAVAASAQTGRWIDIQPDAGFTGWTRVPLPVTAALTSPSQWKVDGAKRVLVCEGNGGHEMLRYDRELGDFVLQAQWRFAKLPGEPRYNGGIFVRTTAHVDIWHQAQTTQAGGYLFGVTLANGEKQRINLQKEMKENRVKPPGEWNAYEVTCRGRTISLKVNGKTVSEFTACDVPKGYIGLEAEGFRVEFRNLRVRPL